MFAEKLRRYISLPINRHKYLMEWSTTRSIEISKGNKKDPKALLDPEVVPITWEPSPDHLIIQTEEAKNL